MKTILCLLCMHMPLMAYSGDTPAKLKPLWEESSSKECKKRCITIIEAVDQLMDIYDELWRDGFLSEDELEHIQMAYMRIRFNLGLASPI